MSKNLMTILLVLLIVFVSCESEKRFPPKGYIPNTPESSDKIEAQYFWVSQDKLSSSYWNVASFKEVDLLDKVSKKLYSDGVLNATGTYNGLSSFNKGNDAKLKIKAGYDDTYIYIWVEWKDTTANADYLAWLWDGDADPLKSDSTTGWTSQRNNDNISLYFTKDDGTYEVWKWSLAYSAPFNMALQTTANANMELADFPDLTYYRNAADQGTRTGAMYEWNDERQEVTLADGSLKILDPSMYLLDDYKTAITADVANGQKMFNNTADCRFCHGPNGNGVPDDYTNGGALNQPFITKFTKEGLVEFVSSSAHEGSGSQYWGRIKNNQKAVDDLLAFLRANAGIPGQILKSPEKEPLVKVESNISVGGIDSKNTSYKLLFRRKLNTGDSNDIEFSPDKIYTISVRVADNDELNSIGADNIELDFQSNEL